MIELLAINIMFTLFLYGVTRHYVKKTALSVAYGGKRGYGFSLVSCALISSLYMIAIIGALTIRNPFLIGRG